MRVPMSWLHDYVDLDLSAESVADMLTMLGLEVQGIERRGDDWENVVVGELLSVRPHPRADRLSLAETRTPAGTFSIVCGATNIAAGQRVPVALPGATLPGGRRIEATTIAGQTSEGMLCSGAELRLTEDAEGILILPPDAPLGRPLSELYGETILDVDVKANRGDLLSLIGIAREVAAVVASPVRWPAIEVQEEGTQIEQSLSLDVRDRTLCPRFVARAVSGVAVAPSPLWVQLRLLAAGVNPVSNVVDASNYAMLELGKPTHTFDAAGIRGRAIVVRRASPGEPLETLDHVRRELDPDTLVIADAERPIGIAGVMGGADSEVGEGTTDVVVESAIFDPVTIRQTARRYGLRSEASLRFEKGQEWRLAHVGADRVCQLIQAWAGGTVAPGRLDSAPGEPEARTVAFRPGRINRLLGTDLNAPRMTELLARLGFAMQPVDAVVGEERRAADASEAAQSVVATIPTWRPDVTAEADIAEEVARLHGYQHIAATLPDTEPPHWRPDPTAPIQRVRDVLAGAGLTEVLTHALIAPRDHEQMAIEDGDGHSIHVTNPVSADHSVLRRSLLPGLVGALAANERVRRPDVALFEIGEAYRVDDGQPDEEQRLAILLSGALWPQAWNRRAHAADIWDARGFLELLLASLGGSAPRYGHRAAIGGVEHPGRTAETLIARADGTWEAAGVVTELDPRVLGAFEARAERAVYAELRLAPVLAVIPVARRVGDVPRLPAVERDLAVVVPAATLAADVSDTVGEVAGGALEGLTLFDLYEGPPLAAGEKSLAFRLALRLDDPGEADAVIERVTAALAEKGWRLRA